MDGHRKQAVDRSCDGDDAAHDAQLLADWAHGDFGAGERLVARRVGEMTRFFRNKVRNEQDVADLVGQVFVALVAAREDFRGETSVRRFLYRLAHNVLCGYIRSRGKRGAEIRDFRMVCVGESVATTPSSRMMRDRRARALLDGLRRVRLEEQTVLELMYLEGLSGREIAELLGIPEGTVRGRLRRGLTHLRQFVQFQLDHKTDPSDALDITALETWAAEVRQQLQGRP